jgi:hypothetical protein
MANAVVGLIDNKFQAERVVEELRAAGFSNNDISVLFPDTSGTRDFANEQNTRAPEGAAAGAGTGGVIGGILGWLAGIGSLALPGVGPFIAAGPLMAALAGAGVGATVGGLTGALIGMGIPEYEAKLYEEKIRGGNLLLAVHSENRDQRNRAKEILEQIGAHDVSYVEEGEIGRDEATGTRPVKPNGE